ncbi:MAG: hypothetical protein GY774_02245 [Planctomycetes bacterium]|nr:hypothetical protein [Planctomycetota bacterium]
MKSSTKTNVILFWAASVSLVSGAFCFAGQRDFSPYPNPDVGYVTDLASLLTGQQHEQLENLLSATEEKTGVEIVVVAINSIKDFPGTSNRTIEEFATALFDAYGIGNMPKNDGVLLLVAVKDRKARIELGAGYGRRRDSDSSRIMNNKIVPSFRKGHYAKGIIKGTESLAHEFAHISSIPSWIPISVLGIAVLVLTVIATSLFKSGKRGWGWIFTGLAIVAFLALSWLVVGVVKNTVTRGGSGGGFGGGGFGGGFSGGGGATGGW